MPQYGSTSTAQASSSIPPQSELPEYSSDPTRHEIRLGYGAPLNLTSLALPTGVYTKHGKKASVHLRHQNEATACPIYGLEASIEGMVDLQDSTEITEVGLRVRYAILSHSTSKPLALSLINFTILRSSKGNSRL